jgi:hypothetical protein
MAKNTKTTKTTKRRTKVNKLSAGEKELTAAEKKKVKGGLSLNFEEIKMTRGNTIGGALGTEAQNTIGGAIGEDVIRTK